MFEFLKSRKEHVEELMNTIKEAGYVEPANPPVEDVPVYQVGKTEDGKITLRIGNAYGFSTLTMTDKGVRGLVRMLESAIEEEVEE